MKAKNLFPPSSKSTIETVLDIGSNKISCIIARINKNGDTQVLGSGCHSSNGFRNGSITNAKLAEISIISAIDQAEKSAGLTIDTVVLALNGNKIKSHYIKTSTALKKHKVDERDIANLISEGLSELEKQGYEVIHYFPLEYIIDENHGISNPIGLLGNKLSARIHFVTIPSSIMENIINCLATCQLNVKDCVFSPYAAALATLSETDKSAGSTLIDIGAGITSYAIFSQNNVVNCGFIPIGSEAITNDISKSFMIPIAAAERIKTIHGSAKIYANDYKMINYKIDQTPDSEERNILRSELNHVINARLEEILFILKNILNQQSNCLSEAKHNIILTGGGSLLSGLTAEVSRLFDSKARLGKPVVFPGLEAESSNASYSTSIGVLQYILNEKSNKVLNDMIHPSITRKILNWLKDNF